MDTLSARITDLKQREAKAQAEFTRLIGAINKAITLILTMVAVGALTVISFAPTEHKLKTDALANQENISRG